MSSYPPTFGKYDREKTSFSCGGQSKMATSQNIWDILF